jgi:hypothetical protein
MKVEISEKHWMKNNKSYFLLLLFFLGYSSFTFSQDFFEHSIKGKVSGADGDEAATHVLNISTKKAAITDIDGYFEIKARLYDTLVFSAVQYKKKQIIVSADILASKLIYVNLDASLTELNEVTVRLYNLSGELSRDMNSLEVGEVVTAFSLGLPNSNVKKMTQTDRILYSAQNAGSPIAFLNVITGETKRLKEMAARQRKYMRTELIRRTYHDSLYVKQLKIPQEKIDDFMYFCEIDAIFSAVAADDTLRLWEVMLSKSVIYRRNNALDTP